MSEHSQHSESPAHKSERSNRNRSTSILFVCLGNICRSPAAEGVMKALISGSKSPLSIHIESAGTGGYHDGKLPDSRMRSAAKKRGYQLDSRAQTIGPADFQKFDRIIAMDRDNVQAILRVGNPIPGQLKLLSDYFKSDCLKDAGFKDAELKNSRLAYEWPTDVPDPYYGGDDGFEYVLDMIEAACPKILEDIQQESSTL